MQQGQPQRENELVQNIAPINTFLGTNAYTGYGYEPIHQPPPRRPASAFEVTRPTPGQATQNATALNTIFVAASICVLSGSFIGFFGILFTQFGIFDLLNNLYIFVFGAFMLVLDAPIPFVIFVELRGHVFKYAKFLTRCTGRGVWFLFLGGSTFAALYDTEISPFLAGGLGGFVMLVGLGAVILGVVKSRRLEELRVKVKAQAKQQRLPKLYTTFAEEARTPGAPQGLTKFEFNRMAEELIGSSFAESDLMFIYNALSKGKPVVSIDDLDDWCHGFITLL